MRKKTGLRKYIVDKPKFTIKNGFNENFFSENFIKVNLCKGM